MKLENRCSRCLAGYTPLRLINLSSSTAFPRAKLMPSLSSIRFLPPFFVTFFILTASNSPQSTASTYLTYCSGSNFTSPSLYETHLTRLLAVLVASTPSSPTLYTTSAYPNSSSPQVFGLAQCRPDASASQCNLCLSESAALATSNITDGCGNRKSAALRYDYCLLRYSDQPFFGAVEKGIVVISGMDAKNASLIFRLMVDNLIKEDLIQTAAASSINFAVGISNSSDDPQFVYGMTWCSMDLKRQGDCEQCLRAAMSEVKPGKERGRAATVSCEVRYESYQFFSTLLFPRGKIGPPPPPTSPPSMQPEAVTPTGLPVTGLSGGSKFIIN